MVTTAILGWSGFTWRRSEEAVKSAMNASDAVDRLELKLAEKYLTKEEFVLQMDRLFSAIARIEEKLDNSIAHNQALRNLYRQASKEDL